MNSDTRVELQKQFALAGATVLLLVAPYMPVGGAPLAPLAFVALVPFAALLERTSLPRMLLLSYLTGVAFFCVGIGWLASTTVIGWLALCLYLALYFALTAVGVRAVRRLIGLPMALALPMAWTSAEFIRAWLLTGLPWLQLGHTQNEWVTLVQVADVAGVYGVSFIIAAINGLIFDALCAARIAKASTEDGRWQRVAWMAAGVAAMLGADLGYGLFRLHTTQLTPGPKLAVVQANIPQDVKHDPSMEARRRSFDTHIALSRLALTGHASSTDDKPVDLIVWPETMIPGVLNDDTDPWSAEMRQRLTELARRGRCRLLVGGTCIPGGTDGETVYNSAYYIDPVGGADRPVERYDKMHLVPFGEYVPLKRLLWFLLPVVPYEMGFSPGEVATTFDLVGSRFGVFICFEDIFPQLVGQFFGSEREVDFLINISNDGWFGDSFELDQHLAITRFRAIENRIGIVRATNTGISAFIAPTGRVHSVLEQDGRRRLVAGYLVDRVMLDARRTLYTRWGDAFAWANLGLCAALVAFGLARRAAG